MNKIVHYIGLDVHKETIAVSIAPQNSTEVRRFGILGATLDAVDVFSKKVGWQGLTREHTFNRGMQRTREEL